MGKIQELYASRVRPMHPDERLQLARMILDDLAPADSGVSDDLVTDRIATVQSPRLANPEQAKDFTKQVLKQ